MNFLHRGRLVLGLTGTPSEPAPEPVARATGLPVAAPAPADGTDALRAAEGLAALRAIARRQAERLRVEAVGRETVIDGTQANRQWVADESLRLEAAGLDDLPAVREFAAEHDPRQEAT